MTSSLFLIFTSRTETVRKVEQKHMLRSVGIFSPEKNRSEKLDPQPKNKTLSTVMCIARAVKPNVLS